MKSRLKQFLKNNEYCYLLYRLIGSSLLLFISMFISTKENTILFVSFGGRKFDDSPRAIYEAMINDPAFKKYTFVWAFLKPEKYNIAHANTKVIKIDSLKYFYYALASHFWIVNTSIERGLSFKRKRNICINTWHGTPLKKICGEENIKQKINQNLGKFDLMCSQSEYDKAIFERIFRLSSNQVIKSDLPRNDNLLKYNPEKCKEIKQKLGIPIDKKVILYMPTFREYLVEQNKTYFNIPMNLNKWKQKLGDQYVLLIRAHYLVVKSLNIKEDYFVYDVSNYEKLDDLYAISDIMISDYSSAFFDFAILNRPELCFAYDLNDYKKYRGLYVDLKEVLPCCIDATEDQVISHIEDMNVQLAVNKVKDFKNKYTPYAGTATNRIINEIKRRYLAS